MAGTYEEELKAEVEAFRAAVETWKEADEKASKARALELSTSLDASVLDYGQIRLLREQRRENAQLQKRLAAAEQRIAELERRDG